MKTLALLFAFCCIYAQSFGQEVFKSVSFNIANNKKIINFSLSREVNTRHYRIEAGNDTLNFGFVGIVAAKGNSMLEKTYSYDVTNIVYKYYRVGIVYMNANISYSPVITPAQQVLPKHDIAREYIQSGVGIVTKR